MKTIFIPGRVNVKISIPFKELEKHGLLGKRVGIATTIQHEAAVADSIRNKTIIEQALFEQAPSKQAPKKPRRKKLAKQSLITKQSLATKTAIANIKQNPVFIFAGKVIGCNTGFCKNISSAVDCFLLIGTGKFHALNIALETGKQTFIFDPYSKKIQQIEEAEITKLKKREQAAFLKFLSSSNIGVIVSTKPGQTSLSSAQDFVKEYNSLFNKKNSFTKTDSLGRESGENGFNEKQFYIFACDTLDFSELENFPFIDCWLNTACPRIGLDDSFRANKPVINLQRVKELLAISKECNKED